MLEKTLEITLLYDFYGNLLTDRQRQFVELYYHHDLSLGEIADNAGVTRQAVYDMLRRAERALRGYEEALGLVAQYERRLDTVARSRELLDQLEVCAAASPELRDLVNQLRKVVEDDLLE